jgi:hypothetical protein
MRWLDAKAPDGHYEGFSIHDRDKKGRVIECSTAEIMWFALRIDTARHDKAGQMRCGAIMRRLGWSDYRPYALGTRVRRYCRPKEADPDAPW